MKHNEYAECVRMLYQHLLLVLAGVALASFMMVVLFWKTQPHEVLLDWFATNMLLIVLRAGVLIFYRRDHTVASPSQWAWMYTGGAFLSGCIWGVLPWLILDAGAIENILILMLVLFGMTASSLASHAPFYPAYLAYIVPTIGLLAIRLSGEGGAFHYLNILLLIFLAAYILYGWNHRKMIHSNIHQRFLNDALMIEVDNKRQDAEQARFSSDSLGDMLSELMEIVRLDSNGIQADFCLAWLDMLIQPVVDEMQPIADEAGLKPRLQVRIKKRLMCLK